jgi:hypothetical protein
MSVMRSGQLESVQEIASHNEAWCVAIVSCACKYSSVK